MKGSLQALAGALSEARVQAVLVGGVAVGQYAATRVTFDIDLAIRQEDESALSSALARQEFARVHRGENFARFKPASPGFLVDLLFLDAPTFELLWSKGSDADVAGHPFRVASPEHLVCMKLHALRFGKAERRDRDLSDVVCLMKSCGWSPAHPGFRDACAKHGTEELRKQIEARWAP